MGLFPLADTGISISTWSTSGPDAHWSGAHLGARWRRQNPTASVRRAAPASLPPDVHHDIAIDSKCPRRRLRAAGARACAAALRLP